VKAILIFRPTILVRSPTSAWRVIHLDIVVARRWAHT